MKKKLFFLFYLLPLFYFAQFSQNVEVTDAKCSNDGTLTITINNATVGATYEIEVLRSGQLVRSENDYTADETSPTFSYDTLQDGDYVVRTTQILNGEVRTISTNATITNTFKAMALIVTKEEACGRGTITVEKSSGNPKTYELLSSDGATVIRPKQESNKFENVPAGTYRVMTTDKCGNIVTNTITITEDIPNYAFQRNETTDTGFRYYNDCTYLYHRISFSHPYTGSRAALLTEKLPIKVKYTVTGPNGEVTVRNYVFTTANQVNSSREMITTDLPYYYGEEFTIKAELEDNCGNKAERIDVIPATNLAQVDTRGVASSCGQQFLQIQRIRNMAPGTTIEFLDPIPEGFEPWNIAGSTMSFAPGSYTATITATQSANNVGNNANPVPVGTYYMKFTDPCGKVAYASRTITGSPISLTANSSLGCEPGTMVLQASMNNIGGNILRIRILSGPDSYSTTYPVELNPAEVVSSRFFVLNSVPIGTYELEADSDCGVTRRATTTVTELPDLDYTIVRQCGGSTINVNLPSLGLSNQRYYLDHYNETKGKWEETIYSNMTSEQRSLTDIRETGKMRWRLTYTVQRTGRKGTITCERILEEFTIEPFQVTLDNFTVYDCGFNKYNVMLEATGEGTLNYQYKLQGTSDWIDNGTEPLLIDLAPGSYDIKILDGCGQTLETQIQVISVILPKIRYVNICNGQNGRLYIAGLSMVDVHWYRRDAKTNELTDTGVTGHSYNFAPFNADTDFDIYEAHITYKGNGCVERIIAFNLNVLEPNNPKAGQGEDLSFDNPDEIPTQIDLFTTLSGEYDVIGDWVEVTNSGLLSGNTWHSQYAAPGTYTFKYIVKGVCTGNAEATVNITINGVCFRNPATNSNTYPTNHGITSLGRAGENQNNWPMLRQSAYTVLESKTKGFTINRLNTAQIQAISNAGNAVDGMMIYDTDEHCLKIYVEDTTTPTNSGWKCFSTPSCPD